MFILIENHTDEIDQYCRLVGTYESKSTAQTVMHSLYLQAKDRNEGEVMEWDFFEDDTARAWWSIDFYDWYIFDADAKGVVASL